MRFSKIFIFFIAISVIWASPKLSITVDRDMLSLGETITLTIKAEESDGYPKAELSAIKDFVIVSGPSQSSSFVLNGNSMSNSFSSSWILRPKKVGTCQIPPLNVSVDGKNYHSQAITVQVKKQSTRENKRRFFIEATVDNENPYRGEQINVTYTLFTQVDIKGFEVADTPSYKGFWTKELVSPRGLQLKPVNRNGVKWYYTIVKKDALFPTRSGKFSLDPLVASVRVLAKNKSNNRDFFFNSGLFSRTRTEQIATEPLIIDVRALPDNDGHVSAFVGQWDLKLDITSREVIQNQALSLILQINGKGNLHAVDIQPIAFPEELEVFDPEITLTEKPRNYRMGGSKKIEYVIIPREAGELRIPAIELLYFDPKHERWESKSTKEILLNVAENERQISANTGLSKDEIRMMEKDIRFLNEKQPSWQKADAGLLSKPSIALIFGSLLSFFLPSIIHISRSRRQAGKGKRRSGKALKTAMLVLNNSATDAETQYATLHSAINTFLNEKMNRKIQRSSNEVLECLKSKTIGEDLRNQIQNILERGESVRFAPVSDAKIEEDRQNFINILAEVNHAWH